MLKKIILTFSFLTVLTTFYGFNSHIPSPRELILFNEKEEQTASDLLMLLREGEYQISAYDRIIRTISEQEGNDWRLMSAIAYHESRFNAGITSRRGARGLMQIMPMVARQFNVGKEDLMNPETNVRIANKIFSKISLSLRLPANISSKDRLSLVLASYNGGIGHVSDARRLARAHGENPNSWEVVSRYLRLKSQPEYYENKVVKCGRFTGSNQTVAYVNDVLGRYDKYCRIAAR